MKILDDDEFITLFSRMGAAGLSRHTGIGARNILARRRKIEEKRGIVLANPLGAGPGRSPEAANLEIDTGHVLVGSDAHIWPGQDTPATRAFIKFCKELKPVAVVLNGDVLDFAKISRYPAVDWSHRPDVAEELEAAIKQLAIVEEAAGKAKLYWPAGNHDVRYEGRLTQVAPEYIKVKGTSLSDHFPRWQPCWALFINKDVVIRHVGVGGKNPTHRNALEAGRTVITGHNHQLSVIPLTDYNGRRWDVKSGMLGRPWGPQFSYLQHGPRNWAEGFIVLTFHRGALLKPETVHVFDEDRIDWRGELVKI